MKVGRKLPKLSMRPNGSPYVTRSRRPSVRGARRKCGVVNCGVVSLLSGPPRLSPPKSFPGHQRYLPPSIEPPSPFLRPNNTSKHRHHGCYVHHRRPPGRIARRTLTRSPSLRPVAQIFDGAPRARANRPFPTPAIQTLQIERAKRDSLAAVSDGAGMQTLTLLNRSSPWRPSAPPSPALGSRCAAARRSTSRLLPSTPRARTRRAS